VASLGRPILPGIHPSLLVFAILVDLLTDITVVSVIMVLLASEPPRWWACWNIAADRGATDFSLLRTSAGIATAMVWLAKASDTTVSLADGAEWATCPKIERSSWNKPPIRPESAIRLLLRCKPWVHMLAVHILVTVASLGRPILLELRSSLLVFLVLVDIIADITIVSIVMVLLAIIFRLLGAASGIVTAMAWLA